MVFQEVFCCAYRIVLPTLEYTLKMETPTLRNHLADIEQNGYALFDNVYQDAQIQELLDAITLDTRLNDLVPERDLRDKWPLTAGVSKSPSRVKWLGHHI